MSEPIYDGYVWPVKTCSRCGKVEEMPNSLCFVCREGDRLAEALSPLKSANLILRHLEKNGAPTRPE